MTKEEAFVAIFLCLGLLVIADDIIVWMAVTTFLPGAPGVLLGVLHIVFTGGILVLLGLHKRAIDLFSGPIF